MAELASMNCVRASSWAHIIIRLHFFSCSLFIQIKGLKIEYVNGPHMNSIINISVCLSVTRGNDLSMVHTSGIRLSISITIQFNSISSKIAISNTHLAGSTDYTMFIVFSIAVELQIRERKGRNLLPGRFVFGLLFRVLLRVK